MEHNNVNSPLINPLPPVILIITLLLVVVEIIFQIVEAGLLSSFSNEITRNNVIVNYAFFGSLQDWMISNLNFEWSFLFRYLTFPFIHFNFLQTVIAIVMFLALGKMVCEVYNGFLFLILIISSSFCGAFFYGLLLNDQFPLVGAFPAIYGLIGAYTYLLWVSMKFLGAQSANAFILVAVLLGIQIIFKVVFNGSNDWVADLFGFLTGFLFASLIQPKTKI